MSLRDRLNDEMKDAMRAKDDLKLSAIRLVRSAVKNREIDQKLVLDDAGIHEVIASLVKQRRESIRMFGEAGRVDLVEKEERELAVLLDYLPRQLTKEEIVLLAEKAIAESGAQGGKDMGKVMKVLKPQVTGCADGRLVSEVVKELLG
ncbi:putative protein [Geobacter sp. OR-1]|uniref:GatB/YqeY domain-containing protein n=1 Tax=Geobacter sp. OR-1 TaxID=1266765 RepID=UPI000544560E|nr:GatB/YqeY domain-containing protein [Geobacter sp. OR-1]GAM09535.1 putative protein [Geobacter sp. OR-1]